jgi:MOSC domain-containing protein
MAMSAATVAAVSRDDRHAFSKPVRESIRLVAGLGVEGDAHAGQSVQHLSRIARDPSAPNVTTRGLDLLSLPTGTRLLLGQDAVVEVTGLRNPCVQLDGFQHGLMKAVLDRDEEGQLVRKAGVMAIVLVSGQVMPGDRIDVVYPPEPHMPLQPV